MTTWSSTRIGTTAATTRILMLMRSDGSGLATEVWIRIAAIIIFGVLVHGDRNRVLRKGLKWLLVDPSK